MTKYEELTEIVNRSHKISRYTDQCSVALRAFRDALISFLGGTDPSIHSTPTGARRQADDDLWRVRCNGIAGRWLSGCFIK